MQNLKLQVKIKKILDSGRKEILSHQLIYLLLSLILLLSAFFRLFRLHLLLGFWYDQGRDALVIWDLIHYKKFFLIGPVTGIEGIFLGPFYYYLLAPFYWLGKGSPVFVAACLSWLTVGAIFLIYWLAKEIYGREAGLIAAFLYGFSYGLVKFSRWLANPNPLPFFTLLALIFLLKSTPRPKYLIFVTFLVGLCLQLEAASAIFFLPAISFIIFWQSKKLAKPKILILSFLAFFVTLLPQIIFNFRHQGILLNAFKKFLISGKTLNLTISDLIKTRIRFYYDVFFNKIFPAGGYLKLAALVLFLSLLFIYRKKIFSAGGKILGIWLVAPLISFLFYQGNFGYVWDYYFTGVIPTFIILFSACLGFLFKKNWLGKVVIGLFLIIFLIQNLSLIKNYLKTGIGITLAAQTKAIDRIYQDAGNNNFNVDVYVPPQIYYAYSYLFRWYGKGKYGREPETPQVKNLYTLYEPDNEHPQFLKAWLKRQDTIGKIIDSFSWGDITVQKRERIKYEE